MAKRKTQISLQLTDEALNKITSLQKTEKGTSRNELIEEAVHLLYGYKTSELSQDYLCSVYGQKVEGIIGQNADRMGRLLYKLAVELNVLTRLIASQSPLSKDDYKKFRVLAVEDAKSSKGIINLYDL